VEKRFENDFENVFENDFTTVVTLYKLFRANIEFQNRPARKQKGAPPKKINRRDQLIVFTAVARFELEEFPMSNEKMKLECVSNNKGMRLLVIDLEATKRSAYGLEDLKTVAFRELQS
jgi:hypothetical protein